MDVDIRDSASLKPAELDELSQVLRKAGSPLPETTIDDQVERIFSLAKIALQKNALTRNRARSKTDLQPDRKRQSDQTT